MRDRPAALAHTPPGRCAEPDHRPDHAPRNPDHDSHHAPTTAMRNQLHTECAPTMRSTRGRLRNQRTQAKGNLRNHPPTCMVGLVVAPTNGPTMPLRTRKYAAECATLDRQCAPTTRQAGGLHTRRYGQRLRTIALARAMRLRRAMRHSESARRALLAGAPPENAGQGKPARTSGPRRTLES